LLRYLVFVSSSIAECINGLVIIDPQALTWTFAYLDKLLCSHIFDTVSSWQRILSLKFEQGEVVVVSVSHSHW
jgi:hypothetical protein